jgi:hypothetical protein
MIADAEREGSGANDHDDLMKPTFGPRIALSTGEGLANGDHRYRAKFSDSGEISCFAQRTNEDTALWEFFVQE